MAFYGFETDVESWASLTGDTTTARSTTSPVTGVGCLKVTKTVASGNGAARSPLFPVAPGDEVAVSLKVRSEITARDSQVYIDWFNGSTYISSSTGNYRSTTLGAYTTTTFADIAPAGTTQGRLVVNGISMAVNDVYRIDDVSIAIGTSTPTVVTVNASWTAPSSDGGAAITGYVVERRPANGTWAQIGTTGAAVTTYADTSAPAGASLGYRVAATNSATAGGAALNYTAESLIATSGT